MVEVFKTNIKEWIHARIVLDTIHKTFNHYRANFDLEDCDKILRVECGTDFIHPGPLVDLVKGLGFQAEVLPDEEPDAKTISGMNRDYASGATRSKLIAK